jgi:hypothetical protein
LILLLVFPSIVFGQNNQVIKGRSATKKLRYSNTNAVKIKKITSDIKIDSLIFVDINKNDILDFGEKGFVSCFISNNSNDTLKDLNISLDGNSNKIIFPNKNKIERIEPQSVLELSIPIKNVCTDTVQTDSLLNLSFDLVLDDLLIYEDKINLITGSKGKPSLDITYNYSLSKDTVINNSKDSVNYIKLSVVINNNGNVPLFMVNGVVKLIYAGGYIISNYENYQYEFINSGDKKEIKFIIVVRSDFPQNEYPLIFEITGNENLFKKSDKIEIEL